MIKINIDGKPIQKLIEVIAAGTGQIWKPFQIVREAKALSEARVIESVTTKLIESIEETEIRSLVEKTLSTSISKIIKEQNNIEKIVSLTASQLSNEKEISDNQISDDWATRFFKTAAEISDEDMQLIWSKLLTEEIKNPGNFSLRTIEVLRNLSSNEAKCFSRLAPYICINPRNSFLLSFYQYPSLYKDFKFDDFILLNNAGLILSLEDKNYKLNYQDSIDCSTLTTNITKRFCIIEFAAHFSQIPVLILTEAAHQLLSLIDFSEFDVSVLAKFKNAIPANNIRYMEIVNAPGTTKVSEMKYL